MRKHENTIVLVLILVIATPLGYLLGKNIHQQKELLSGQTLGQGLTGAKSAEYRDIDEHCPVRTVMNLVSSDLIFYIDDVYCAYVRDKVDLGEVVTVEIYTQDLTTGKQEFRNWLAEYELEEGDTLRVKYEHKPK